MRSKALRSLDSERNVTCPCYFARFLAWVCVIHVQVGRVTSRICSCCDSSLVNMNQGREESVIETIKTFDCNIRIINSDQSKVILRTNIERDVDIDITVKNWIENFSKATCTDWIVNRTYPQIKKTAISKRLCLSAQYAKNKQRKVSSVRERNKNCGAKIFIKVKKENKFSRCRDPFLKEDLNAIVEVHFTHSHRVSVAEAYSYLRISWSTKDQFLKYLEGLSPSEAKHFHTSTLMAITSGDKICETLANAQVNPMERSFYHLYEQWRKENYGEKTSKSVFEKLVEKKAHFEVNRIKMFLSEEPFCCVVITPLMLRAHSMHVSSEIVFVDSSGSCDQMGNSVTFFFGATKIGGVPLGCMIDSYQTQEVYEFCFQKFTEVLGSDGFAGKGAPSVFMTDDSAAEINALHTIFPGSTTLLCTFHVM